MTGAVAISRGKENALQSPTYRILCVEADSDTCVLLGLLLGRADYEVECVGSVADGLRLAAVSSSTYTCSTAGSLTGRALSCASG